MREKGFSLVEVLVAIGILALMTLGVANLVESGHETRSSVIPEDREYLQAYMALSRLGSDIDQIWSPLYYSTEKHFRESERNAPLLNDFFPRASTKGHLIPIMAHDKALGLSFFTTSNRRKMEGEKQSRFAWVYYSLEQDEERETSGEKSYFLVRRLISTNLYTGDQEREGVRGHILMRGVKKLTFEFWDSRKKKWEERLRELPPRDQMAPRGIKVVLVWQDLTEQEYTHIKVFRPLWPPFKTPPLERERNQQNRGPRDTSPVRTRRAPI